MLAALTPPATAQAPPDDLGVAVDPVGTDAGSPNDGEWFVAEAEPGATIQLQARLVNLSDVDQHVLLYLADLIIGDEVTVGDRDAGVGAWGGFATGDVVIAARETKVVPFSVTVPATADPGDHIGAVVVEADPRQQGNIQVVTRVAKRLYVTVPGDATPGLEIESVKVTTDRALLPRTATVTVVVKNTGNVRLAPEVLVEGHVATGADLVMSRSSETLRVRRPVPIWGGRLQYDVEVTSRTTTGEGPSAEADASTVVLPWWVLLAVVLLLIGVLSLRQLRQRLSD